MDAFVMAIFWLIIAIPAHADIFGVAIAEDFYSQQVDQDIIIELIIDWDLDERLFFGIPIVPGVDVGSSGLQVTVAGQGFPFPTSGTIISQDLDDIEGLPKLEIEFSGVFSATQAEMRSGNPFGFVWPVTSFIERLPATFPTNITYVIDGIGRCISDCESGTPIFDVTLAVNGFQAATTPTGTGSQTSTTTTAEFYNVNTQETQSQTIDVEFTEVTASGSTTVSASTNSTASFSFGFQTLPNPLYLDIVTNATVTFPALVCLTYVDDDNDGVVDGTTTNAVDLRLLHNEDGTFVDRTVLPVDTVNKRVCAEVMSFSEFIMAQTVVPSTIAGKKLVLSTKAGDPTKSRLALQLPIGTLPCLAEGNDCDPTLFGVAIEIGATSYLMPASNWRRIGKPSAGKGYAYSDGTLSQGPIVSGSIRNGMLRLQGRGAGLTHTLGTNLAPVHAALLLPELKFCTQFGGITTFKADARFTARNAPIPAACLQ
jgi:hypothetical protein